MATSEARQAADLRDAFDAAGSLTYLGPLFWYSLADSTGDQTQRSYNFCGLSTVDGTKKAAWTTYRRLATHG